MLKALRRMINKHVYIKSTSLYSTRMKSKTTRARLDQPVNRIEFNRFDPAVELGLGEGASGAPESMPEKKNRSKRSGAKATHLPSSPKTSPVAGPLSSGKKSSKKSEKPASARKAADAAGLSTPEPFHSKTAEGTERKSGGVRSKKSARRAHPESSLVVDEDDSGVARAGPGAQRLSPYPLDCGIEYSGASCLPNRSPLIPIEKFPPKIPPAARYLRPTKYLNRCLLASLPRMPCD